MARALGFLCDRRQVRALSGRFPRAWRDRTARRCSNALGPKRTFTLRASNRRKEPQLPALAYEHFTDLRCIELPEPMANWSLIRLQLNLIHWLAGNACITAKEDRRGCARHSPAVTFQMAEVAVTSPMVRTVFAVIRRLREPPLHACLRARPKPNKSGGTGLSNALKNLAVGSG